VALKLAVADDASGGAAALTASPDGGLDIAGHRTAVRALAVAEDDSLLMSASAEAVKIWSSSSTRCIRTMPSGYGLCGFFVSGNEHVVLGTKDGDLELFDLRVGEFRQRLEKAHDGAVYGLAVDPDGGKSFVSCSADKHLKFFNIVEEGTAVSLQADDSPPVELPDEALAVVFSPNGKWIAAALLNHTVQLIFADSRKFYLSLYGHRLPVMSLDMSSDSQVLATGSADKSIKFWSPQFGNCLRSMRAHEESIMQVRFLPGTHYLVSAARDKTVKLWDCDTYELITALQGHSSEIMALALSQDAAFIVTAGADRQIRFWRRTQEQLFLSEERAKELDEQFEKEAERDDIPTAGMAAGGGVSSVRPSRRTIESVRSTERLMEVLDEAKEAKEAGAASRYCPSVRVVQHVNTLNAGNIYEVLLALPFAHSLRMLEFLCEFFEAMSSLPSGGTGSADGQLKLLSAAATLETPCQAALISAYVHHREFSATSTARPLLLRLRTQMRLLLTAERNRIGFAMAGFGHLQRALKRSSAGRLLDALPEPQKKKKKGKA